MFKFVQISSSRNSFSKGIGILNKLTKNAFVLNSTYFKFNFSTVGNLNNSFAQQNLSCSFNQMCLNSSYLFTEFGAKKKSSENLNEGEEIFEVKTEKVKEKKSKNSIPKAKTKPEDTKISPAKFKEGKENEKMEADKNSTKSNKTLKKTKTSSTLDENEKNSEEVVVNESINLPDSKKKRSNSSERSAEKPTKSTSVGKVKDLSPKIKRNEEQEISINKKNTSVPKKSTKLESKQEEVKEKKEDKRETKVKPIKNKSEKKTEATSKKISEEPKQGKEEVKTHKDVEEKKPKKPFSKF